MSYSTVIFDMDGVIFDSERALLDCWRVLAVEHNIRNLQENYFACIGTTMPQTKRIMAAAYGPDFPYDRYAKEASKMYHDLYDGGRLPIKEGTREIFEFLKSQNKKIAVASSTRQSLVIEQLKEAGLVDYFDCIVGGEMVLRSKPDPDIYLSACKQLNISPKEAFAVEDSYNGIKSAYAAGVMPIMVPDLLPANDEMREKAAVVCDSLLQVIDFLSKQ